MNMSLHGSRADVIARYRVLCEQLHRDALRALATQLMTAGDVKPDHVDAALAIVAAESPAQIERDVARFAAQWIEVRAFFSGEHLG